MAFSVGKSSGDDEYGFSPVSDINVTPLVDVMLVLLIVFMVAAPLMAAGIPVNLPKSKAKQLEDSKPPIVVSIDDKGKLFVDKDGISEDRLVDDLKADSNGDFERRVHVRADKNLPYGRVIEVMGLINGAGFNKVALVSEAGAGAVSAK